ncbi:hypothetical protein SASPL_106606 [Salvia splendens]|uniref:Response regulatory domain-containing protein n=1 Tax=Salvia splendens TaxID=180675 RepID=A0A8X8YM62_SALSN|nr:hypothetical protein SASPL_106606 [Salvia splendens]
MYDDGETSKVMKGIQHGACHCLVKPIRLKEIRNVWQHVFRKRMHQQDDNSTNIHVGNKRKQIITVGVGVGADPEDPDPTPLNKKPRVVWTPELHQKFVNAVHCIGGLENSHVMKHNQNDTSICATTNYTRFYGCDTSICAMRMEYNDEPVEDDPTEYSDEGLEATYNWSSATHNIGTDHANAYLHCLW